MELLTAALVICGPVGAVAVGAAVRAALGERRMLAAAAGWLASGEAMPDQAQLQTVGGGESE